jgi:Response regulator containing a CheY-like receiver domain and an HTH DNA-binding domain
MIKVLIADDQMIIREGIKRILSLADDIEIIGEAENGFETIKFLEEHITDIILLDIRMPKMNGLDAAKRIIFDHPSVGIIVLTTFKEDAYIFESIRMGIQGYILKDSDIDDIISCIRKVYNKKMVFDSDIMPVIVDAIKHEAKPTRIDDFKEKLSIREYEIALLIIEGKSNLEISNELYIAEGTVKNCVSKILNKLGLNRRAQLISMAK